MFSLFFFQAEDGIRYGHVTGVQTCALPIYRAVPSSDEPGKMRTVPVRVDVREAFGLRVEREIGTVDNLHRQPFDGSDARVDEGDIDALSGEPVLPHLEELRVLGDLQPRAGVLVGVHPIDVPEQPDLAVERDR